jgi:hypothetical protein
MELYTVEIPSIPIVPKLQWGDSYLEVSLPKQIEDLAKLDNELRKRRHPYFYDFYVTIQARTFTNMLVTNPKYYKQLEPSTKPPSPFNKYYDADELKSSISKRLPIVSPNAVLFPTLPICNHENIRMLNIINQIQFLDADGLLLYRQSNLNIHVTKNDEYHILEVPDMLTSQQIRLDPSFFKQFSKKPYYFKQLEGTLCNQKMSGSYDIIIMNLHIFKYTERTHTEYRDLQSHLSIASQLTTLLKKGGTFLFSQHYTYFKLTNDFFHILANLFDSVKVVKTINDANFQPYKSVVCTGFKANVELERSIRTIYETWFLAEASCGMKIGVPVIQRLLGGTPEIKSIQTIIQNSLKLSIQTLQEVEEKIKTPEQLPLYIMEAKIEAKYIYNLMKVFIPISYLFKASDLKAMFHQPDGVHIIVKRSSNSDRLLHSEFNETRSKIEMDLFTMKRQIDFVNNLEEYSKITDLFKITNRVLKYPSRKIIGEPVSQAFLKMCELLHDTELVRSRKIDVFHLCEAPGQFILAFRHYCKHKHIDYNWTATSLKKNPDGSSADIFDTYGLIKRYPTQWIWGADETGNIMHLANIRGFAKKQYDIVTSDCGWPTQDFGFQEEELLQINHGQLTAMLMCLKNGGNCVFKTFLPIMYPLSLSLFYILYIHFEKVIYFKGLLNPSSSEIYVVGINFKGLSKPVEDAMCHVVQKFNPDQWLFKTFEKDFIKFHTEAIQACVENTKKSIIRSILMYHYYNPKEHNELLQRIQNKEGSTWIQKYLLFGESCSKGSDKVLHIDCSI